MFLSMLFRAAVSVLQPLIVSVFLLRVVFMFAGKHEGQSSSTRGQRRTDAKTRQKQQPAERTEVKEHNKAATRLTSLGYFRIDKKKSSLVLQCFFLRGKQPLVHNDVKSLFNRRHPTCCCA